MPRLVNGRLVYDAGEALPAVGSAAYIDAQNNRMPTESTQTDPLRFGAAGRGEFAAENAAITEEAMNRGVPMSEIGNYQSDPNYRIPAPAVLSKEESVGVANEYGLAGIGNTGEYAGMTRAQANAKAEAKRNKLKSQTSQNTSYAFNPETISGFNNKFNNLKISLDSINNDPWTNKDEKKLKTQALIKSYNDQFADLFSSPEDFNVAAQNLDFQKTLQKYQAMGGDINGFTSRIGKTQNGIPSPYQQGGTVQVVSETPNPDGTYTVKYSDGTEDVRRYSQNADGTYTSKEAKTLDQFLGDLNSPEAQKAADALIPEKSILQEKIAFENSIPEKYKDLYFGTEDQVGLIQQKKDEAQAKSDLLARQAELDKGNARAQAALIIEKNNADMDIAEAETEQNRLAAKNYMTGMLAKLGALNTTGAAPLALATLEQKYQMQKQKLKVAHTFANRQIEVNLNKKIDEIELDRDEKIIQTKSDLSKSEEDVVKEIFKLQNSADSKTLDLVSKYTTDFTTRKEKYAKEAKDLAARDLKERQRILEKFNPTTFAAQHGLKDLRKTPSKGVTPTATVKQAVLGYETALKKSRGTDGWVDPFEYKRIYDEFINKKYGTTKDFVLKFPPNKYVNPAATNLPEYLRNTTKAKGASSTGASFEAWLNS